MKAIFDYITEDELTEDLRMLADVCGIDCVRKILENLSGMSFYIPKVSRFERFIDRYIAENNAKSIKALALELGVSDQYLRNKRRRR